MAANYGPGSFSDEYDNQSSKSLDRFQDPGGVTGIPFEDDLDLTDNNFNPQHGEGHMRRSDRDYPRDADLGRSRFGTEWTRDRTQEAMDNLARSELRPDLHPDDRRNYGLGPKGWKRSDEKILDEVCMALERSHEVDPSELEVKVEDGCVYLKGSMVSKGMQRVAEDLVGSVPGVVDVFTQVKINKLRN